MQPVMQGVARWHLEVERCLCATAVARARDSLRESARNYGLREGRAAAHAREGAQWEGGDGEHGVLSSRRGRNGPSHSLRGVYVVAGQPMGGQRSGS
jgi:hypothetical protein